MDMDGTDGAPKCNGDGIADLVAAGVVAADAAPVPKSPLSVNNLSLEELTTRVLRFLSTASTETIAGIAVGLAAVTYLVLGRMGLILIGALGGIVLHASWEGNGLMPGTADELRKEKGLDIVRRLLDLRENRANDGGDSDSDTSSVSRFEGFQPETATALNEFVDAVIRNYVKWWYDPILPNEQTFPAASRQTFTRFVLAISSHLSRKRPADTFLDFLTNSSSIVIVFLNELASALSVSQGTNIPVSEAVHTYLAENPESNLANVLNMKQQSKKFKMVAEDILQNFLDKQAYDCDPARIFLREVLSGVVLEMTLTSCSKPEWINGWIVYLLEDGEPDISQAIDAGMGNANGFMEPHLDAAEGNCGIGGAGKQAKAQVARQEEKRHKKRLSKAEEAMEEAMEEAKRLSRLIAEDDAKKLQSPRIPGENAPISPAAANESKAGSPDLSRSPPTNGSPSKTVFTEPFTQPENPFKQGALNLEEHSPLSRGKPSTPASPPTTTPFTSFDQIIPQSTPVALQGDAPVARRQTVSLTLHNANILIHDDSTPMDKGRIRNKPNGDYLVQIEPASSQHPGWMIVRRYSDFESLHEVLRRIAQVSGVTAFAEQHHTLPSWKDHTKASLQGELERYLRDACWYQQLAESEGMKRFLEKDQGQAAFNNQKSGFPGLGWPTPSTFETMGKGVLDVLTSAPKGVAESGKVIGGGISGVFSNIGNLGQKKPITHGSPGGIGVHTSGRLSTTTLPRMDSMNSLSGASLNGTKKGRASEDSLRTMPIISTQPSKMPEMERRPSYNSIVEEEKERQPRESSARSSMSGRRSATQSREPSRAPSRKNTPLSSPIYGTIEEIRLPPPPSEMSDEYSHEFSSAGHSRTESSAPTIRTSTSTAPSPGGRPSLSIPRKSSIPLAQSPSRKTRKDSPPLTDQETRVAVELLFAVINELYTLSSAWNIRRTLLAAAKTFLLRPGNPSLSSIQSLIQDSLIASNTSDAGIASHLRKLRANTMPTEDEAKAWPPEMTMAEKERLRIKARKLLIDRGIPAALTGVMGQAASGEAMGRVFEVLQEEEVARGLIFALLLQSVRAITH
jgi:hypothetical protein